MPEAQPRKRVVHRGRVLRTERIAPAMVRIVLHGEGLREFSAGRFTDHYVKMHFPPPGVEYADPTDIPAIRRDHPRRNGRGPGRTACAVGTPRPGS